MSSSWFLELISWEEVGSGSSILLRLWAVMNPTSRRFSTEARQTVLVKVYHGALRSETILRFLSRLGQTLRPLGRLILLSYFERNAAGFILDDKILAIVLDEFKDVVWWINRRYFIYRFQKFMRLATWRKFKGIVHFRNCTLQSISSTLLSRRFLIISFLKYTFLESHAIISNLVLSRFLAAVSHFGEGACKLVINCILGFCHFIVSERTFWQQSPSRSMRVDSVIFEDYKPLKYWNICKHLMIGLCNVRCC